MSSLPAGGGELGRGGSARRGRGALTLTPPHDSEHFVLRPSGLFPAVRNLLPAPPGTDWQICPRFSWPPGPASGREGNPAAMVEPPAGRVKWPPLPQRVGAAWQQSVHRSSKWRRGSTHGRLGTQ
ncbi:hypothetical protein TVNIR_2060 [Thioalkalivibrio nitratireducens DSM 14787]|uniref:Uncharacterized protein n=1 Tax=Thioalkalivibrio nitratireducens (strain DSM 14787 / UNIQEM 213 / ALEN2) TaxID=1255043 RepID=L0DXM7_THIND|nr:hypothetical protein TVNIR_2060 [Thioalkalivibrio nitratireducens DSM 14787]